VAGGEGKGRVGVKPLPQIVGCRKIDAKPSVRKFFFPKMQNLGLKTIILWIFQGKIRILSSHNLFVRNLMGLSIKSEVFIFLSLEYIVFVDHFHWRMPRNFHSKCEHCASEMQFLFFSFLMS